MNGYEEQMINLLEEVKQSDQYVTYHMLLDKLNEMPLIYEELNDYRQKMLSVGLQNGPDAFEQMNQIRDEYEEILNQQLISKFLSAEQELTKIAREIITHILEGIELDVDFLDKM